MKKLLAGAFALACLLLAPGAALAQTQLPPCVPTSSSFASCPPSQPSSILIAPSGGGYGPGKVVAPDNPFPTQEQPGENHIGEVGGNTTTITVAQTVTASSAYAAGNAVGALMTLSTAARVAGGSGLVQSVVNYAKSAQTTQVDVFLFNANPTGSTCTDKTAFDLAAADFDKLIGVAHVSDWTAAGATRSFGQAQSLAMPFALASGTTIYACAVTRSTPTYTSTSDISFGFRILRN